MKGYKEYMERLELSEGKRAAILQAMRDAEERAESAAAPQAVVLAEPPQPARAPSRFARFAAVAAALVIMAATAGVIYYIGTRPEGTDPLAVTVSPVDPSASGDTQPTPSVSPSGDSQPTPSVSPSADDAVIAIAERYIEILGMYTEDYGIFSRILAKTDVITTIEDIEQLKNRQRSFIGALFGSGVLSNVNYTVTVEDGARTAWVSLEFNGRGAAHTGEHGFGLPFVYEGGEWRLDGFLQWTNADGTVTSDAPADIRRTRELSHDGNYKLIETYVYGGDGTISRRVTFELPVDWHASGSVFSNGEDWQYTLKVDFWNIVSASREDVLAELAAGDELAWNEVIIDEIIYQTENYEVFRHKWTADNSEATYYISYYLHADGERFALSAYLFGQENPEDDAIFTRIVESVRFQNF